ncbi:hypothetical protein GV64_03945 [Endozoicomonas elysicola]|uniref:Uncharacterized protein n=1 Tax=Endozoicomonas elysicola TaxID=305900 RepID=A0A081K785_9GAMM|nr:hypothetical protein GV64_03945 [Endozoicomonas elysicola]
MYRTVNVKMFSGNFPEELLKNIEADKRIADSSNDKPAISFYTLHLCSCYVAHALTGHHREP